MQLGGSSEEISNDNIYSAPTQEIDKENSTQEMNEESNLDDLLSPTLFNTNNSGICNLSNQVWNTVSPQRTNRGNLKFSNLHYFINFQKSSATSID